MIQPRLLESVSSVTAVAPEAGRAGTPDDRLPLWVLAARAGRCSVEERAAFAAQLDAGPGSDRMVLVTCHRAELFGVGQPPELSDEMGAGHPRVPRLELLTGETAVRHAFRLAAGLESAVIGEDQVLHQVRELREEARRRRVDAHLSRLFEIAIGVGRRSRAERSGRPGSAASLATRAVDWLCLRGGLRRSDGLLVVGAGRMGGLLAVEGHRRGLDVTVASRSPLRAATVATRIGGHAVGLADAAALAQEMGGVAIALGGPWEEAAATRDLPPTVDLSSPPALPALSDAAGQALDIDGLYRWNDAPRTAADEARYQASAGAIVDEAVERYRRWSAGRASLSALRELRDRGETRRAQELERLLRRLPDLEPRERALVEAFSQRLVAGILHSPTARLRDDVDGSAAAAARRLFEL